MGTRNGKQNEGEPTMMFKTHRNTTATEMEQMKQAEAELDAMFTLDEAKRAERKPVIIRGLVAKYGFDEEGAKKVMALIEQSFSGEFPSLVNFTSEQKRIGAEKAMRYFWS